MSNRRRLTTVVLLSQGDQLGAAMKRLRIWLDSERIEPSDFKTAVDADGYTFTIGFRRAQDAKRFRAQFGE
jgi:outer membrane lipoprotein-sorting protein